MGIFNDDVPTIDKSYKDTNPCSIRLVRTASKAFGEGSGSDDKVDVRDISNYLLKNSLLNTE